MSCSVFGIRRHDIESARLPLPLLLAKQSYCRVWRCAALLLTSTASWDDSTAQRNGLAGAVE